MNGMVSCKNCAAQNTLDSTFCKKCGTTLPDDEVLVAKQKLDAAVTDGFKLFTAGRTDEAMRVAETAVRAYPTATNALSLKAMCHDRLGQISEALECHEKVLEIDPDSVIDKMKANELRNLLVARTSAASVPDRRMAVYAAVAALVLVVSIGVVVARTIGHPASPVASNLSQAPKFELPLDSQIQRPQTGPPGAPQNNVGASSQSAGDTGNQQAQSAAPSRQATQTNPGNAGNAGTESHDTPTPNLAKYMDHGDNLPGPVLISPDVVKGLTSVASGNPTPTTGANVGTGSSTHSSGPVDPEPSVGSGSTGAAQPNGDGDQTTKQSPGVMEISIVSKGGKQADGGSSDLSQHPNGVEALIRTARNQYLIGNYSAAATSYERALRAGADAASGNQRLAECYEKLGRNSDASAAYTRAISAIDADLKAGKGDKDRLTAALGSCQQALKVLGG